MFSPVVNTTKTFNFNPTAGEIVLDAFGRCQIRPSEITQSHMFTARMKLNLLLSEWSNNQVNLWEVDLQTIPLVQGSATYSIPAETVMILDAYISYGTPTIDRYINPLSRTEYASIAVKSNQGFPSQYWFDRLISPTITFYLTPDGAFPYVCKYYRVRQTQDADVTNGYNVEVQSRWMAAFTAGMAWMLAETYRPELEDKLFNRYMRAWEIAARQDTENTPLYVTPSLGGYFR
jgi:hypothetical protein